MKGLTLFAALLVGLAAPASAMSVEEIATYNKPDRQKVLEDLAKKEGELLSVGGTNAQEAMNPMVELFRKKYPFLKVNYLRMGTPEGLARILAEYRAKTPRIDLFNGSAVEDLKAATLAQPFRSPVLAAYPDELKDPEGYYATLRLSYEAVNMWNTKQVKSEEAPRTYEDLLNPKWKGKIAMSDSPGAGTPLLITFLRKTWGEEKALNYLKKLAANKPIATTTSTRNLSDLVIAGEYPMMLNPANQHIGAALKQGAPVDGAMSDPTLARSDYVMLIKTAPHPASAMLMIDFLIDVPAQELFQKGGYAPAHPQVKPEEFMKPYTPTGLGYHTYVIDDKTMQDMAQTSLNMFRQIFQ